MKLGNVFVSLSIFSSGIYTQNSGGLQPSIILLLLTTFYLIWKSNKIYVSNKSGFYSVFFFLIYTILVNIVAAISGLDTFLSAIQQMFNLLVFLGFYCYFKTISYQSYRSLTYLLASTVLLYFLLAVFGVGRYDFAPRYNGFFNDPNQMAYWILCVVVISGNNRKIYKSGKSGFDATRLLFQYTVGAIIIAFYNYSRSGLLGILVFGVSRVGLNGLILAITLMCLLFIYYFDVISNYEVFSRFLSASFEEEIINRGLLTPYYFPEYLLFGSGHGSFERFGLGHEIHSSIIGSFIFYGIPVTFLFIFGIIFARIHLGSKLSFIALLSYGLTTYGFRTPIFWIAVASIVASTVLHSPRILQPERRNKRNNLFIQKYEVSN